MLIKKQPKQKRVLKAYRLAPSTVEALEVLQHECGFIGEREASDFMNEFLELAIDKAFSELDKKSARKK